MKTLSDLELDVLRLPELERATLAARLLDSLPAVLADDDEGVAEALRRDAELEHDAGSGITLDELRRSLKPSR
jgi:putative addiction module component (TIGR02574 family)